MKKELSEHVKNRLAESGFYVDYSGKELNENPTEFGVIFIGNKTCQYIHWQWGEEWIDLTWTCAPTKKAIERAKKINHEIMARYLYFPTHDELLKFKNIHLKKGALIPPIE